LRVGEADAAAEFDAFDGEEDDEDEESFDEEDDDNNEDEESFESPVLWSPAHQITIE